MKRFSLMAFCVMLMGLVSSAWGQSPLCPKGKTVLVPYVDALVIPVVPKPNHCVADPTDSDGDGLADDWELAWFGNLTAANGALGSLTDVDEDGISDREEYERGGNPTIDDASVFLAANRCHQRYLPFGGTYNSDECGQIKHAGRVHDKGTDLHYNRARYYDAAVGQFLSADPVRAVNLHTGQVNLALLQNPQQLNPYAYALNNPYRYEDPNGEIVTDVIDVGFFVLSLVNFVGDPSFQSGVDLGLDTLGLLPGLPALGTARRFGAKALNSASKVDSLTNAEKRSKEIHSTLDRFSQDKRTTAVLMTKEGIDIVSSSRRRLDPSQRRLLRKNEIEAIGSGHAEIKALNEAKRKGLTPLEIGTSRPICDSCTNTLRDEGFEIVNP